jgi:hypothetical protein
VIKSFRFALNGRGPNQTEYYSLDKVNLKFEDFALNERC